MMKPNQNQSNRIRPNQTESNPVHSLGSDISHKQNQNILMWTCLCCLNVWLQLHHRLIIKSSNHYIIRSWHHDVIRSSSAESFLPFCLFPVRKWKTCDFLLCSVRTRLSAAAGSLRSAPASSSPEYTPRLPTRPFRIKAEGKFVFSLFFSSVRVYLLLTLWKNVGLTD